MLEFGIANKTLLRTSSPLARCAPLSNLISSVIRLNCDATKCCYDAFSKGKILMLAEGAFKIQLFSRKRTFYSFYFCMKQRALFLYGGMNFLTTPGDDALTFSRYWHSFSTFSIPNYAFFQLTQSVRVSLLSNCLTI